MLVPENFKSILWEYDLSKLNMDSDIVAERVLSLGDKNITDFWIQAIGKENAKKLFIKNKEKLDKKSLNHFGIVFGVDVKNNLKTNRSMYDKLNTPIFTRSFR